MLDVMTLEYVRQRENTWENVRAVDGVDANGRALAPGHSGEGDLPTEFTRRYREELTQPEKAEALAHLRALAKERNLTLLTSSKAVDISEATVLAGMLG